MDEISVERAVPTDHAAEASLEELLAFERLLFDLSARFANVADEQVIAEIESALKQLLRFLGFDRGVLIQSPAEGKQEILCSVAVEGVEPHLPGPIPACHSWLTERPIRGAPSSFDHTRISRRRQLPSRILSSRRHALQLVIPLPVGGRASLRRSGLPRSVLPENGQTTHRARKRHRRSDGPSAPTQALRGSASGERGTLAVNI